MTETTSLILTELQLTSLGYRCRQETARFWQNEQYDSRFCHALFTRALAQPHEEGSKDAWQFIHRVYYRQVMVWVKGHPQFPATQADPGTLADLALERMWLSFANSPDKYGRFPHEEPEKCIRALMSFLQACVYSTVIDALRTPSEPLSETMPHYDQPSAAAETFWECIEQRLNSDQEKLLMDTAFIYGLKPRQILELYPDDFSTIKEIYRLKENILARFKRDASLHHCLEMAGGFDE